MRILLLEDQQALLASTKKGLEEMGFGVDAFGDGDAAMQRALDTPYDALVLDIMVPGRDGLSILRALRERRDSVPVILVTARAALPEKIEGLNLGADDYLRSRSSWKNSPRACAPWSGGTLANRRTCCGWRI